LQVGRKEGSYRYPVTDGSASTIGHSGKEATHESRNTAKLDEAWQQSWDMATGDQLDLLGNTMQRGLTVRMSPILYRCGSSDIIPKSRYTSMPSPVTSRLPGWGSATTRGGVRSAIGEKASDYNLGQWLPGSLGSLSGKWERRERMGGQKLISKQQAMKGGGLAEHRLNRGGHASRASNSEGQESCSKENEIHSADLDICVNG
jgi:hypothetical protein